MTREMLLVSCLTVLLAVMPGLDGSYPATAEQENLYYHGVKDNHGNFQQSQESYPNHPVPVQHHQQYPVQDEQHLFQPHQQFVVQSAYNVGPRQEQPVQLHHQHTEQQPQNKQRQTALPYNNQRLHVKVEHPAADQGFIHPTAPAVQHLRQPIVQEPKQDYRAYIPKSIAPKLNPLHHSFHQKRNFVPLHHITRQVPIPAGKGGQGPLHQSHGQQQPVKVALVAPQPKHIAG